MYIQGTHLCVLLQGTPCNNKLDVLRRITIAKTQ